MIVDLEQVAADDDEKNADAPALTQDQIDKIESGWRTPELTIKGGLKIQCAGGESCIARMLRMLALTNGIPIALTRTRCSKEADDGTLCNKNGDHELLNQVKMFVVCLLPSLGLNKCYFYEFVIWDLHTLWVGN